jgi:SAM-dependent methyltransferase
MEENRAHFLVEQELAERLRHSTRAQRPELFRTLYAELFARVPEHARVLRRDNPEESQREVASRLRLLQPHLAGVHTFLEFAPGDCRLAWKVCEQVGEVLAVDISDQSGGAPAPRNFRLIVYDGYTLDLSDQCADLLFSFQFIEHLHPDDVLLHFQLAHRLLRPGGKYILATPHRFSGPHDVSRFFSDVPQGFHLKEWTYRELGAVVKAAGFSGWHTYRFGRLRESQAVNLVTLGAELALGAWPRRLRRKLAARIFSGVTMGVEK